MTDEQKLELQMQLSSTKTNKLALYKPYDKQQQFHNAGADYRIRMFLAANRTGKTYSGVQEGAYHLTGLYPKWWKGKRFEKPIRMWAATVTNESTMAILQQEYLGGALLDDFGSGSIPKEYIDFDNIRYSRAITGLVEEIRIKHTSGGWSRLVFKSYQQGREKFQGTAMDFIHLDEEPPQDIFSECTTRLATTKGHLILTMTPLSGMTAVCEKFLEGNAKGHWYVNATWEDNPYLDQEEMEDLAASYAPHEKEARMKGIPALGSGKVYPVTESSIEIEPFLIPKHFVPLWGLDFGWNNTAAVVGHLDRDTDTIYLTDCYLNGAAVQGGEGLTPAQHAAIMPPIMRLSKGVCDPAGGGTSQASGERAIDQYKEFFDMEPADNSVEPGLMEVLQRMRQGRLKVFKSPNMEPWWKEFRTYARDEKGGIRKRNDHLMDATRYLVVSGPSRVSFIDKVKSRYREITSNDESWMVY